MDGGEHRKARGAFFTPPHIADYLVRWALRSPGDTVLEPSCGEASFLLAAAKRLTSLGAPATRLSEQLHGVEIFHASARNAEVSIRQAGYDASILTANFFQHRTDARYDAVVGNPPFVRYQHFAGADRAHGLEAALAQGIRLSGLASSWAAFVVHASLHVTETGRLALVLPAELLSVNYAKEVRRFLLKRFARVRLIVFEDRVFPGVLEEVVLLLAEGSGGAACFEVHQTRDVRTLQDVDSAKWTEHAPCESEKWTPALVDPEPLADYREITGKHFETLARWGRSYLGSVTGSNRFFSLTAGEARQRGLGEADMLRISPPGGRHLRGLTFSKIAWSTLADEGARCFLFRPRERLTLTSARYIAHGEASGVAGAYKCRMRSPWWRVPLVDVPDLFLTYMNHDRPRLVTNAAGVHILNSVYGVRLAEGRRRTGIELLPIASMNSVTLLGAEIVGRSYGGGLLKMEPREADRLPIPSMDRLEDLEAQLVLLRSQVSRALRSGQLGGAVDAVDEVVLAGVPRACLHGLRRARDQLFQRRRSRGRGGSI
jgi:tRNA1(Val) A37 N6-methylase TrmN6